ncbi:MAG: L-threonine 3-dehydrogenase [Archangium sp.]|nr:L-threonine 3-dehydrogenase [Archangium sp.]
MRALVKSKREPGLWMEDVAKPQVGPNDVLIKVQKTGICGTDIHIYNWDEWSQRTIKTPMHIGHEFMGVVAEVGSEVTGFKPGDRVSGEGHITCGNCRNCRAGKRHLCRNTIGLGVNRIGCFAEFVTLPGVNVFKLPDAISDEIASFFDPLGNAVHTALSFDLVGEDVLITGAGPIGVMAAAICRHVGARHVVLTDVNDFRLELGRKLGATRTVNVAKEDLSAVMQQLGMTEGFDVGLEMSGNGSAFKQMFKTMNHGGRVALLGIPTSELAIDWNQVIFKGLVLKGIYGREMFETWYKMTSMLQSGLDISAAVTHRYPAAQFKEAFEIMRTGQSGKVVLDWAA